MKQTAALLGSNRPRDSQNRRRRSNRQLKSRRRALSMGAPSLCMERWKKWKSKILRDCFGGGFRITSRRPRISPGAGDSTKENLSSNPVGGRNSINLESKNYYRYWRSRRIPKFSYGENGNKVRSYRGNITKSLRYQIGKRVRYQFGAQHLDMR